MDWWGRTRTLFGLTAAVVIFTMSVQMAPRQAVAAGARYESREFGFTIEWDDEIWTGEEAD